VTTPIANDATPAERRAALALVSPAWLMFVVLLAGPTLAVFVLSLTDWQLGAPTMNFIGLGNYGKTLTVLSCPTVQDETYKDDDGDDDEDLLERWTPRFRR